jgi:hypothetical protein
MKRTVRMLPVTSQELCPFSQVSVKKCQLSRGRHGCSCWSAGLSRIRASFTVSTWPGAPGGLPLYRGRGKGLQGAGRKRWRCIVAAGVAVAVVLCMSWAHASRIRPGLDVLDNHMIETAARLGPAGTGSGRCPAGSALASVQPPGRDLFRRGPGDVRRKVVRVVLAADVRPGKSKTDSPDSGQASGGTARMRATGWPPIVAIPDVVAGSFDG